VEHANLDSFLDWAAPLVVRRQERFFLIGPGLVVVRGDGATEKPGREALRGLLGEEMAAAVLTAVERVLEQAGLSGRARTAGRRALLGEMLHGKPVNGCWLLRPGPDASAAALGRSARLKPWLAGFLAGVFGEYAFWLGSWWLLGSLSLSGRIDSGQLAAWVLLLFTTVPCRLLATLSAGQLAVRGGALFKDRLLAATLRQSTDAVRRQGVGQLLGRALEAEQVETQLQEGAQLLATGALEVLLAGLVLTAAARSPGGPGWFPASLLVLVLFAQAVLAWMYVRTRRQWLHRRLDLTHDLVEGMVGHRTRLAQQPGRDRHDEEDRQLKRYLEVSARQDRLGAALLVAAARGWLILGLLGLGLGFVTGAAPVPLAVAVGGLVLGGRAFRFLAEATERLATAWLAWEHVRDLTRTAAPLAAAPLSAGSSPTRPGQPILEARDVVYAYPARSSGVLEGVSLRVHAGDRLLIEGPSGSGKSTLAGILAGMRQPQAGLVLLGGLGREVIGEDGWRSRVVIAPPFHDNHVLQGTLAFNLLMGRDWPPSAEDLSEAERICRGLELGPLLERMPGGLFQLVGETGWQLSHGERSRVFLARALLQGAEVLILDESFAALDAPTLERALRFVRQEAKTLIVIAHP
jgi:ATP-binding cassette subfamily B protein